MMVPPYKQTNERNTEERQIGWREKYRTPTHMAAVQRLATARNGRAEILVDFVLRVFATELYDAGRLASFHVPKLQKVFRAGRLQ